MTFRDLINDLERAAWNVPHRELAARLFEHAGQLKVITHELREFDMSTLNLVDFVQKIRDRIAAERTRADTEKQRADHAEAQLAAQAGNTLAPEEVAAVTALENDPDFAGTAPANAGDTTATGGAQTPTP